MTALGAIVGQASAGEARKTPFEKAPVESDVGTALGHYGVTNGFKDRTFASAWGNFYRLNGWGTHAEAHYVNREETAGLMLGGLSYNTAAFSIKGVAGTSTNNSLVMPEFYARLEGASYSKPADGLIFRPSVTYRSYRAGIEELTLEGQVQKYIPAGKDASWIWQAFAKNAFISLGDHQAPSGGVGVAYSVYKTYTVGLAVEAGVASYDSIIGLASLNERFSSVRPHASVYLNDRVELFAQGELTDRTSYRVQGAHIGLKFALD